MSTLKVGDWVYVKYRPDIQIKISSINENGVIVSQPNTEGQYTVSDVEKITDEIQLNHLENYHPFLR